MTTDCYFVSGCDSGFGRALALKLARAGKVAFAGCFTKRGEEELASARVEPRRDAAGREAPVGTIVPVALDVTSDESVRAAAERVRAELARRAGWTLRGVVNNAGLLTGPAPAEWQGVGNYERMMAVNLLGGVRLTNALLPLIRASRGRVVCVASIAGMVGLPYNAAYSATKFAVVGWAETLRRDLKPFGVTVHVVFPGIFAQTGLYGDFQRGLDSTWKALPGDLRADYGEAYYRRVRGALGFALAGLSNKDPEIVSDAMLHALTSDRPRYRYLVGRDAEYLYRSLALFPDSWADALMTGDVAAKDAVLPASARVEHALEGVARYDPEYVDKARLVSVGVLAGVGLAAFARAMI